MERVAVPAARTLERRPTATRENPNVNTRLSVIVARRRAGSAKPGAQAARSTPSAGTRTKEGPTTVKSGRPPAKTTIIRTFETTVRRLAVCAARTLTQRGPDTAGSGKNRALMTDIRVFKIIVARRVDDAVNKYKY